MAASARKALPGARGEGETGGSSFRRRRKVFRGPCARRGLAVAWRPTGGTGRRCGFRKTASSIPEEKAGASDMAAQIGSRLTIAIPSLFTLVRANEAWRSDSTRQDRGGSSLRGGNSPLPEFRSSKSGSAAPARGEYRRCRKSRETKSAGVSGGASVVASRQCRELIRFNRMRLARKGAVHDHQVRQG